MFCCKPGKEHDAMKEELLELKQKQEEFETEICKLNTVTEKLKQGILHDDDEILSLFHQQSKTETSVSEFEKRTSNATTELNQGLNTTTKVLKELQKRQQRYHEDVSDLLNKQFEIQSNVSDLKAAQAATVRSVAEIEGKQTNLENAVGAIQQHQQVLDTNLEDLSNRQQEIGEKQQESNKIANELKERHEALEKQTQAHHQSITRLNEMFEEFKQKQIAREQEVDRSTADLVTRLDSQEQKHQEIEQNLKQTQTEQREICQKVTEEVNAMSLSENSKNEYQSSALKDITQKHRLLEAVVYDQVQVVDTMRKMNKAKDEVVSGIQRELDCTTLKHKEVYQILDEIRANQKKSDKVVVELKKKESERLESIQKIVEFYQNERSSSFEAKQSSDGDGAADVTKDSKEIQVCTTPVPLQGQEQFFSVIDLFQSVISLDALRSALKLAPAEADKSADDTKLQEKEGRAPIASISDVTLEEKTPSKNQNAEEDKPLLCETDDKILKEIWQKLDLDKSSLEKDGSNETQSLPQEEISAACGDKPDNSRSKTSPDEKKSHVIELELKMSDTEDVEIASEIFHIDTEFISKTS